MLYSTDGVLSIITIIIVHVIIIIKYISNFHIINLNKLILF